MSSENPAGIALSGEVIAGAEAARGGEEAMQALLPCTRAFTRSAEEIEALFAPRVTLPNGIEGASVHDLIQRLRAVSNREYRNIVGMLNFVRQSETPISLGRALPRLLQSDLISDGLRTICRLLGAIYDQGHRFHAQQSSIAGMKEDLALVNPGAQWEREFTDRTLRLVRVLYPLGINMRNPSLLPHEPFGVDARRAVTVLMPGHRDRCRVLILPDGERSRVIHAVKGSKFEPEFGPLSLEDGQALRVGRSLSFERDIYGLAVPRGGMSIPVEGCIEDERTSRGGLMILRSQGMLYLFDCGSRHEVSFSYDRGEWTRYEPSPRLSDDGYENGRSGVYRRRCGT